MAHALLIHDVASSLDCMRQLLCIEGHALVWVAGGEQGFAQIGKAG